jgi:hypothetical protein
MATSILNNLCFIFLYIMFSFWLQKYEYLAISPSISRKKTALIVAGNSRWNRYLGMTAAMTQVPVPTAMGDFSHAQK